MERLFELWLTERNLLSQRFMVFLLFNSILFLSFTELLEQFRLACGIACAGVLFGGLSLWYFYPPSKRLGKLQNKLRSQSPKLLGLSEKEFDDLKLGGIRGHELATIGIPSFVLALWLLGLIFLLV